MKAIDTSTYLAYHCYTTSYNKYGGLPMDLRKVSCINCKDMFFEDEDSYTNGYPVCSYCVPKMALCYVCNKMKFLQREAKYEVSICQDCKKTIAGFPNTTLSIRFLVLQRDGFKCSYCGRTPLTDNKVELQVDHVVPKSKGGSDAMSNYLTACRECNVGKIDILIESYWSDLAKKREEIREKECGERTNEVRILEVANRTNCRRVVEHRKSMGKRSIHSNPSQSLKTRRNGNLPKREKVWNPGGVKTLKDLIGK